MQLGSGSCWAAAAAVEDFNGGSGCMVGRRLLDGLLGA